MVGAVKPVRRKFQSGAEGDGKVWENRRPELVQKAVDIRNDLRLGPVNVQSTTS